eukprot:scaffold1056_cov564-Prasinococcus_capsulatus_cf.AAC.5
MYSSTRIRVPPAARTGTDAGPERGCSWSRGCCAAARAHTAEPEPSRRRPPPALLRCGRQPRRRPERKRALSLGAPTGDHRSGWLSLASRRSPMDGWMDGRMAGRTPSPPRGARNEGKG